MNDTDDRAPGSLPDSRPSPYLVIRSMAGVYGTAEVRITAAENQHAESENGITIVDRDYHDGDPIDGSLRTRIVDAARAMSRRTGLRLCVVFGDQDAVYVEPNGRAFRDTHVPSGGRWLHGVQRRQSRL